MMMNVDMHIFACQNDLADNSISWQDLVKWNDSKHYWNVLDVHNFSWEHYKFAIL